MPSGTGRLDGPTARCWCGGETLAPWSPAYLRCERCATLVVAVPPGPEVTRVEDEATSRYGLAYFDAHAQAMGHPTLEERARLDLPERCAFWLRTLLRFRPPPARTLELGCASGAFVALLAEAGYDAAGLDLSPAVTARARETFQVPTLTGPLEIHRLPPGGLDVIVLMDVLEHLPDPLATLRELERLLAPGGLLLVQTPRYEPARSFEALQAAGHPFLAQLKPAEHLYLLSQDSAAALLARAGLPQVRFVPAIFSGYDMCFVATREPLEEVPAAAARTALQRTRGGRVVEALLAAAAERDAATARAEASARELAEAEREVAREAARARAEAQAGREALAAARAASEAALAAAHAELARLREVEAAHVELRRRLGFLRLFFGARRPGLDA